ncbi:efflux RND transporter permease subunit [Pseudoalteromonas sp. S16_S37]|uniref:efflux RND transporter permease subunit n=1 Tax=Pseudoalteromonas sp. S16_S37 TaxID=2720228 RepID=UPI001680137E|nr:efflux RND transporter permease subunit [Pseudoalteromonas sp. S16_S37]MBD1584444.1 efflux RND transporter permease subunit [Pseudoalteromonas sp. S16_S37]
MVTYFLNRPAVVFSSMLLLVVLGLLAATKLPFTLFPQLNNSAISVTSYYPGASADVMDSRVTSALEEQVISIDGVDYITAQSANSFSAITINLKAEVNNRDVLVEVIEKVKSAQGLPGNMEPPVVQFAQSEDDLDMAIAFSSEQMSRSQTYEYLSRVMKPMLESIEGIAVAKTLGSPFALKIMLDNDAMAALDVDAQDVLSALREQNSPATSGYLRNGTNRYVIEAMTDINDVDDFSRIKIKAGNGSEVRLDQIANVSFTAKNEMILSRYQGKNATVLTLKLNQDVNPLEIEGKIKSALAEAQKRYPYDLQGEIIADSFKFIRASLWEVAHTITLSLVIVFFVLYLCTGTVNTVFVPLVTIPISICGIFLLLHWSNSSFNSLTLLAIVLAIGIVVDDAIVVYENILRRIEEGEDVISAVEYGTREIVKPIIGITLSFVTVYLPVLFIGGIVEQLFTPFAITLAGSVLISGAVSLILTPTMCRTLLKNGIKRGGLGKFLEHKFEMLRLTYNSLLARYMRNVWVATATYCCIVFGCIYSVQLVKQELAPKDDPDFLIVIGKAAPAASTSYVNQHIDKFEKIVDTVASVENYNYVTGIPGENQMISFLRLKDWSQRAETAYDVQGELFYKLSELPGLRMIPIVPSYLPGASNIPFQAVITTVEANYTDLYDLSNTLLMNLRRSGNFAYVIQDLKYNIPYIQINIDRDRAAQVGVSPDRIATVISLLYSSSYVQKIGVNGRTYDVIIHNENSIYKQMDEVAEIKVRNNLGELIPLSSVATFDIQARPQTLNKFNAQKAVVISGELSHNTALSAAIDTFDKAFAANNDGRFQSDYSGASRSFFQQQQQAILTLILAVILITFLLIILYGRSLEALLVVLTVFPITLSGAFGYLYLSENSLNIFSQIAILTLLGLILKHAILIMNLVLIYIKEKPLYEAVLQAAGDRFRAIIMTTFSMVLGAIPLCMATGAGAAYRLQVGWMILYGMIFATVVIMFLLPAVTYHAFKLSALLKKDQKGISAHALPK